MTSYAITVTRALSVLMMVIPIYPASASTIDFDCDVPKNHYSSITQDINGPISVSGIIELVEMRSGDNLPLAGVRFVSANGLISTGFRLMASSERAKQLDVKINTKSGEAFKEVVLGQVDVKDVVPFTFSLSQAGRIALNIGGRTFGADFIPIVDGKEMAYCSTAQFKFTKLLF